MDFDAYPLKEEHTDPLALQLKEACRTTGAHWAAVALKTGESWKVYASTGLTRAQQASLKSYVQKADTNTWLCGAVSLGRCRWRNISGRIANLPGAKLYLYPAQDLPAVIMVNADELHGAASGVWRMLASNLPAKLAPQVDLQPMSSSTGRPMRALELVQQVLACLADEQPVPTRIKRAILLVAGYYPDGQVEFTAEIHGEEICYSCGKMPENALVLAASLNVNHQNCGSLYIAVPQSRRAASSDRLLAQILAQIFSTQLELIKNNLRLEKGV